MKTAEIRTRFLEFFKKNGHVAIESASLVPSNDPTLLFTTAGMVQFKDVFLGKDPRPYTRATTAQKCVRAGGKHNDLENVGFTARHHTFFEMLGNFSFGDYFKKEAIHYAWQFVTEELKLPKDRLYVTVFETDDEAAEIWHQQENVPKERIYRFGEKDNFWSMGDTGPCGPCSELFIDRGEKYGCGKPTCKMGCDCDRYMEFWNLVFMQYNRDAAGKLHPLEKPSVDTGAGLERIASILQDVSTNYDTDAFLDIISKTADLIQKPYRPEDESAVSFRVVADHSRATAFLINDGVLPSNEGRGYVLRRIMRRAIRHGKKLGFTGPFLHKTAGFVVDQMKTAYPDLVEKRLFIERAVLAEEEQFFKTLEKGLSLLDEEMQKLSGAKALPGPVAFKMYDTFGFPLDLTRVICEERGLSIDEEGFKRSMDAQRAESRKHWKGSGDTSVNALYLKLASELSLAKRLPQFVGYENLKAKGECLALLAPSPEGNELKRVSQVDAPLNASSDSEVPVIEALFSATPFYGESGGQAGDQGKVFSLPGGEVPFEGEVIDVQRPTPDLIVAQIKPRLGSLRVGDHYLQEVDAENRSLTARNHTATHMLQWALREVLGKHVKQSGSLVTAELLRFDFSHFQSLHPDEIRKVEDLVNQKIWEASEVSKKEMAKEDAVAVGAIAFFGEKYGDRVRVVSVGDFSTELCGGTHVDHSSDIHLFKIINESGIAAGVRRIIAYTSKSAFQYLRQRETEIFGVRDALKASSTDEIGAKLEKLHLNERDLKKKVEQFESQSAALEVEQLIGSASAIKGTALVAGICQPNSHGMKRLRDLSDKIKQKKPNSVMILAMKEPDLEKVALVVAVGPEAPKQLDAGQLLKSIVSHIGGKGGGKADFAQAGGTLPSGMGSALTSAKDWVENSLKS